jgi:hypothetical protein
MAKSIMDYIFRWLVSKFLDGDAQGPLRSYHRRQVDSAMPRSVSSQIPFVYTATSNVYLVFFKTFSNL